MCVWKTRKFSSFTTISSSWNSSIFHSTDSEQKEWWEYHNSSMRQREKNKIYVINFEKMCALESDWLIDWLTYLVVCLETIELLTANEKIYEYWPIFDLRSETSFHKIGHVRCEQKWPRKSVVTRSPTNHNRSEQISESLFSGHFVEAHRIIIPRWFVITSSIKKRAYIWIIHIFCRSMSILSKCAIFVAKFARQTVRK